MANKINVTIWNEFTHEKSNAAAKAIYPKGIHACIRDFLADDPDLNITLAALDDPDQGLPDEVLNNTDVLLWWGHMRHGDVDDSLVARIRQRVYARGMGFMPLHSAHHSKPFRSILGTNGDHSWGDCQKTIVWNIFPSHPIAAGVPDYIILEDEEMYGEPFFIPPPDELVFVNWYEFGNIYRSGCCWHRGLGKIFFFQPGHETCRAFHNPGVQRVIRNGIHWCAPTELGTPVPASCRHIREHISEIAPDKY
ncbi:MAG: trehalose utilization protein ThuA [Clostridiales bacterium]|nr:trehalose utilization protein ThuA [Clostridiales bacterium]